MEGFTFARKAINIDYRAMEGISDRPRPADKDFVGSFSQELIKGIAKMKCSGCEENLMDKCKDDESPPMTGYCGLFFCFGCAVEFRNTFMNKDLTKPPADETRKKNFEVECGGKSDFLYECKIKNCKEVEIKQKKVEKFVRIFGVNKMLKNIYKAVRQPGFLCRYYDKVDKNGKMEWKKCFKHPLNNSLHCDPCRVKHGRDQGFTCAWHAGTHMKCKKKPGHEDKGLQIMASTSALRSIQPDPYNGNDQDIPDNHLATLDIKNREIYAALYHCARCGNSMKNDETLLSHHSYLKCGHFVGAECMDNAREAMIKDGVYCIFCKENLTDKNDVLSVFPRSQELVDRVFYDPNPSLIGLDLCNFLCEDEKCRFNGCNTQFPKRANVYWNGQYKICQWCEVEHELLKRKGGCNFAPWTDIHTL